MSLSVINDELRVSMDSIEVKEVEVEGSANWFDSLITNINQYGNAMAIGS